MYYLLCIMKWTSSNTHRSLVSYAVLGNDNELLIKNNKYFHLRIGNTHALFGEYNIYFYLLIGNTRVKYKISIPK